jgi:hypothetical protein
MESTRIDLIATGFNVSTLQELIYRVNYTQKTQYKIATVKVGK